MTKNKKQKKIIRARAARTGERYVVARAHTERGASNSLSRDFLLKELVRAAWTNVDDAFDRTRLGEEPFFLGVPKELLAAELGAMKHEDRQRLLDQWGKIAFSACALDPLLCRREMAVAEVLLRQVKWKPVRAPGTGDVAQEHLAQLLGGGEDGPNVDYEAFAIAGYLAGGSLELSPGAWYRVLGGFHAGRVGRLIVNTSMELWRNAAPTGETDVICWLRFADNGRHGQVNPKHLRAAATPTFPPDRCPSCGLNAPDPLFKMCVPCYSFHHRHEAVPPMPPDDQPSE